MRHGDYTHDYDRLATIASSLSADALAPDNGTVLVSGDTHGDMQHFEWLLRMAVNHGINTIVQVGDFGYWPHLAKDNRALSRLNERAKRNGIRLLFIDGNHENFTALFMPRPTVNGTPFEVVNTNIFYIPRGSVWTWAGKRMLGIGGAPSTDKAWRRSAEAKRKKSQQRNWFWWPQEALVEDDVDRAITNLGDDGVYVMFSHDAPASANITNYVPGFRLDNSPPMMENRDRLQRVMNRARPDLLFHGHYHERYSGEAGGHDYVVRVEGLGANVSSRGPRDYKKSALILNLNNLTTEPVRSKR